MSDERRRGFDEALRAIARELEQTVDRLAEADLDGLARRAGVDPDEARAWTDGARTWLHAQAEQLGEQDPLGALDDLLGRVTRPGARDAEPSRPAADRRPATPPTGEDPLDGARPHPLDVPSDEQGLALSALASGRWTVEPGTATLAARGDGPAPTDALGLVRELRVRDWLDADGQVTVVGRHALERWLATATR